MLYFAYGSNMSSKRLESRLNSVKLKTVAKLNRHNLKFHKRSTDGSGKCDIDLTEDEDDVVYGVLYEIEESDKTELDSVEGLGSGYEEKQVSVTALDGETFIATTYYATHTDPSVKPYEWYKEHVLRGAREHGLPTDYIAMIDDVETTQDYDRQRRDDELDIYP